jgi:hypothetical protein
MTATMSTTAAGSSAAMLRRLSRVKRSLHADQRVADVLEQVLHHRHDSVVGAEVGRDRDAEDRGRMCRSPPSRSAQAMPHTRLPKSTGEGSESALNSAVAAAVTAITKAQERMNPVSLSLPAEAGIQLAGSS